MKRKAPTCSAPLRIACHPSVCSPRDRVACHALVGDGEQWHWILTSVVLQVQTHPKAKRLGRRKSHLGAQPFSPFEPNDRAHCGSLQFFHRTHAVFRTFDPGVSNPVLGGPRSRSTVPRPHRPITLHIFSLIKYQVINFVLSSEHMEAVDPSLS